MRTVDSKSRAWVLTACLCFGASQLTFLGCYQLEDASRGLVKIRYWRGRTEFGTGMAVMESLAASSTVFDTKLASTNPLLNDPVWSNYRVLSV